MWGRHVGYSLVKTDVIDGLNLSSKPWELLYECISETPSYKGLTQGVVGCLDESHTDRSFITTELLVTTRHWLNLLVVVLEVSLLLLGCLSFTLFALYYFPEGQTYVVHVLLFSCPMFHTITPSVCQPAVLILSFLRTLLLVKSRRVE